MPSYFLAIEGEFFDAELRPVLADCRRQRSFLPLVRLQSRLTNGEPTEFLQAAFAGAGFDRHLWRAVVGELLLLFAAEVPEIPLAPRSLAALCGVFDAGERERIHFSPIEQVLGGSAELTFGPYDYRPFAVGYNDIAAVRRLAAWLGSVDTDRWHIESLRSLEELADDEARSEELALAKEGLAALRDFYARSVAEQRIIVCEPSAT